jgi:hypothetical protein
VESAANLSLLQETLGKQSSGYSSELINPNDSLDEGNVMLNSFHSLPESTTHCNPYHNETEFIQDRIDALKFASSEPCSYSATSSVSSSTKFAGSSYLTLRLLPLKHDNQLLMRVSKEVPPEFSTDEFSKEGMTNESAADIASLTDDCKITGSKASLNLSGNLAILEKTSSLVQDYSPPGSAPSIMLAPSKSVLGRKFTYSVSFEDADWLSGSSEFLSLRGHGLQKKKGLRTFSNGVFCLSKSEGSLPKIYHREKISRSLSLINSTKERHCLYAARQSATENLRREKSIVCIELF